MNQRVENWKPFPDEPRYLVSDQGRVRGPSGVILKPYPHKSGHLQIVIAFAATHQNKSYNIHVLVIKTFGEPRPSKKHECRHKDGIPSNNFIENLHWGTRLENQHDLVRHAGRWPRSIITYEIANKIRCEYDGLRGSMTRLAEKYGVSTNLIYKVIRNKTYREIT